MSGDSWYYYLNGKQEGPTPFASLKHLVDTGVVQNDTYVWCKRFQDWQQAKQVPELWEISHTTATNIPSNLGAPPAAATQQTTNAIKKEQPIKEHQIKEEVTSSFNTSTDSTVLKINQTAKVDTATLLLSSLNPTAKNIYIKTGFDRGGTPKEFGPFDLNTLRKLYVESRINGRTLVYFPGIDCWRILGIFDDFENIFNDLPPIINDSDRRRWERKPFTARLFFTSDNNFYEGICKDISVGGMQVLLNAFPGKVGDVIKMNVHPENVEHQFVAKAKIVRISKNDGALSMEFMELNDAAKRAINTYLSEG
ncbi:MAG: GYF domain-containing protein [Bacteriovoracaceae bacterium]|nr:GYF domain-containing protein [Bacteriovoracaceae bacterium]